MDFRALPAQQDVNIVIDYDMLGSNQGFLSEGDKFEYDSMTGPIKFQEAWPNGVSLFFQGTPLIRN